MSDVLEKLEDVVDFLKHFEKMVDAKRIIALLKEEENPILSRICEEAKFAEADYRKLSELAIKPFWTGVLKVNRVSSLTKVIQSFRATEGRRRRTDSEISRYWGGLPESPVGKPSATYHLFSVPYETPEGFRLLHHAMNVGLALELLKNKGFTPAGLRELLTCYQVKPKVYPPAEWRDRCIDDGSLIAPGDCFAGKYPLILIGTQMAKSWGRVPGDVLTSYTGDIRISPEKDYLLMREPTTHE